MPNASPMIYSLNAGELTPLMAGRIDQDKYRVGCKRMENFIPLVQGPARRRSGTRFVKEVKSSSVRTWLVPFVFNFNDAYVLEHGANYLRFYTSHGQVIVSSVSAWSGATAYVVGNLASRLGVNYYCILAHTNQQPPNATYWYPLTGSIYEIPSTYAAADLIDADNTFLPDYVQSGDVMYFVQTDYQQQKLSRFAATNWTFLDLDLTGGPFKDTNTSSTTIYSDASTGSVTLTASASTFQSGHVGALIYLAQKLDHGTKAWEVGKSISTNDIRTYEGRNYKALNSATTGGVPPIHTSGSEYDGNAGVQWNFLDAGYGIARITGYSSATVVTATVISRIPDGAVSSGNASTQWALGLWSDVEGWPSHVDFFRERLALARASDRRLGLSVAGSFEDFSKYDEGGQIVADRAVVTQIASGQSNPIRWMLAVTKALLLGTSTEEFAIFEQTPTEVFGPENRKAELQSGFGSNGVGALQAGEAALFVQRSGRKMREVKYEITEEKFKSGDTTVLAEHITKGGITQTAYQKEPYSVIWCVRDDGTLVGFTYNREQDVLAWHRHLIGGDGVVESIAVIPDSVNGRDELWMIVKRTINGSTKRYIEYMLPDLEDGDDPQTAVHVDSSLTLDNTVAATLTPGTGATVKSTTDVLFIAGSSVFSSNDVGRFIHYRYQSTEVDANNNLIWKTAKAEITSYTSGTIVTCTIRNPFPSTDQIASSGWRMTVTTITGLSHLEGESVMIVADGASHPNKTVSSGAITLDRPASYVHVGLACPAVLQTTRIEVQQPGGTGQGKLTRIVDCSVRLKDSLGVKLGPDENNLDEVQFRSTSGEMDEPPPLYTGDKKITWPTSYSKDPWIMVKCEQAFPCTVIGLMPNADVTR